MKKLNTHECKTCKRRFINFKEINEHVEKYKHYTFKLIGSELGLCFASKQTNNKEKKDE